MSSANDPIIFLDLDGVLNNRASKGSGGWGDRLVIAPDLLSQLEDMLLRLVTRFSTVRIVITSNWGKIKHRSEIVAALRNAGAFVVQNAGWNTTLRGSRGQEIAEWLKTHRAAWNTDKNPPYVCLDDDTNFGSDQNLVWVDPEYGLTRQNVDTAIELLEKQADGAKPVAVLPPGMVHELLDRSFVVQTMFDQFLYEHPLLEDAQEDVRLDQIKKKIDTVANLLGAIYQEVGALIPEET